MRKSWLLFAESGLFASAGAEVSFAAGNEDPGVSQANREGGRPGTGKAKRQRVGNDNAEAGPSAAEKGRRRFAAPCSEDVSRAFQMLDPRGTGSLDPYALRDVCFYCLLFIACAGVCVLDEQH